jgi:hypothetical protein
MRSRLMLSPFSLENRNMRLVSKKREEIIHLPCRGQCGRAAAARALSACCAAGYAKDCTAALALQFVSKARDWTGHVAR